MDFWQLWQLVSRVQETAVVARATGKLDGNALAELDLSQDEPAGSRRSQPIEVVPIRRNRAQRHRYFVVTAIVPAYPDLGWGELAQGGVKTFEIPGDHDSMLREPNVEALAERLREVLA